MWDWKYFGVRAMRLMLAEAEQNPDSRFGREMTPEFKEMIRVIKPVKSTEIRKVVKLALSQIINPMIVTRAKRAESGATREFSKVKKSA